MPIGMLHDPGFRIRRARPVLIARLAAAPLPIFCRRLLARGRGLILAPERHDVLLIGTAQRLVAQAVHAGVGLHQGGVGSNRPPLQ